MEFIETQNFTRLVQELLPDEQYHKLQVSMMEDPTSGAVIKGGGGIRKLRYALPNTGKSGGVRVIYYWVSAKGIFYMLLIYPKSAKDNLTERETTILRDLVKELSDAH